MRADRIFPETLQQLILDAFQKTPEFKYQSGVQPFLMTYSNKPYYVYVKNLSSAFFRERPDTTRAQLPIKDEFEEIKESPYPFIFLGYDQNNDVLVCWNYHVVKQRLNAAKSVSFYSRKFFQEAVIVGGLREFREIRERFSVLLQIPPRVQPLRGIGHQRRMIPPLRQFHPS